MIPQPILKELERNIPSLRRYAFSLVGVGADADDLVQDCLVSAMEGLADAERRGHPALAILDHAQSFGRPMASAAP